MSINKLLGRRNKSKSRPQSQSIELGQSHFNGSFTGDETTAGEHHSDRIREIKKLLAVQSVGTFSEEDVKYAMGLPFTGGEVQATVEFLKFLQDSQDMLVTPYNPKIKFQGAVNRNMTTCYLDSLLFAMFGCHTALESMLVTRFTDKKKDRLATLLRLWVNTERSGRLITTDITKQIQDSLAECGWPEAAEPRQQDTGEAYTFICEKLGLPNLYLKMDLFHHGKEDINDDHKIVQDRLLEFAIPDPTEERPIVTLEECAEPAMNARVDVRRQLMVRQRQNTLDSLASNRSLDIDKGSSVHIESVEVQGSGPSTPISVRAASPFQPQATQVAQVAQSTQSAQAPPAAQSPVFEHPKRPLTLERRTPSIFKETVVTDADTKETDGGTSTRDRAGSVKKEVLLPAWQIYSLIPFHSEFSPENDQQVAHHFQQKNPIFGIRLKRYGFGENGRPVRKATKVDIPLVMNIPSFIHDDSLEEGTSLFDKFRLSLLSAVCHRGESTESGHYVSLARGREENGDDCWFLFDDLAQDDRVQKVDVYEALKKETPYLLFYQVVEIEDSDSLERDSSRSAPRDSGVTGLSSSEDTKPGSDATSTRRQSIDTTSSIGDPRGRRASVALTDEGAPDIHVHYENRPQNALTPSKKDLPSRKPSKLSKSSSKSRHASPNAPHHRLSTSLNRLTGRVSGSSEALDYALQTHPSKPAANTMGDVVVAMQEKERAKQRKKEEKSGKLQRGHSVKHKHKHSKEQDDRECVVM